MGQTFLSASDVTSSRADRNVCPTVVRTAGLVRLADVTLAWQSDGSFCGASAFNLEPGGAEQCLLRLPDGCDLVQASVEGVIVSPLPLGEGHVIVSPLPVGEGQGVRAWRLPLASPRRPQPIEVIFRGAAPKTSTTGRLHFETPTLGDVPIRRTLWTILLPDSWTASVPQDAATIAVGQAEMLRLRSDAAAIKSGYAASADGPAEVLRCMAGRARVCAAIRIAKPARRPLCSTFGVSSPINSPSN